MFETEHRRLSESHLFKLFSANISPETDKQLVELIHEKALEVLSAHQPGALRYQSITLFLRGRLTSQKPFY